MNQPAVSVVIPVYNEARTIHLILDKIRRAPLPDDRAPASQTHPGPTLEAGGELVAPPPSRAGRCRRGQSPL